MVEESLLRVARNYLSCRQDGTDRTALADAMAKLLASVGDARLQNIIIRVQLARENRLMNPLSFYQDDVKYLLDLLGIEIQED